LPFRDIRHPEGYESSMPPIVSVIILNWNGLKDTLLCVQSLLLQSWKPLEIHIVDNGSENNEADMLEKAFGTRIRLHRSSTNLGFTGGCNLALSIIKKEKKAAFAILLNNDAIADPNWVLELVSAAGSAPDCGIFASCMRFFHQPELLENAGVEILWNGDAVPRGRDRKVADYQRPVRLLAACGGAMMLRCELLETVGLLDDSFFANFEDVDYSLRAQALGYDCLYVPKAIVDHKLNVSIAKVRNEAFHIRSLRNLTVAIWANLPWQVLLLDLPWILARDLAVLILSPLFGQMEVARIVLRARMAAFADRKTIIATRNRLKPRRKKPWFKLLLRQKSFFGVYARFFVEAVLLRQRRFLMVKPHPQPQEWRAKTKPR
jgi:GT2 family glycosyltransferase